MGNCALQKSSQSSEEEEEKMNIHVTVSKTVALNVAKYDTIRNLKEAVRKKEGISENFHEIYCGDKCLRDDSTLFDCSIPKNSTLHLVPAQNSEVVKLIVKIPSMKKIIIKVEAERHDTVQKIKSMIQAKERIHADKYTLLYAGKLLENSRTLSSLGIKDEATFYLVFNPREVVTLSVKLPTGEIINNEVKMSYTVRDVKEIVGSMFDFAANDYNLVYRGGQLEDSLTLASYNISGESIMEIIPRGFQIFVKLWSGKTITLFVHEHDTVSCVKSRIFQKLGIPHEDSKHHYCVHDGRRLLDGLDLAQLGVGKDSTLEIKVRLSRLKCCNVRFYEHLVI